MSLHAAPALGAFWSPRSWWYFEGWAWVKRTKPTDPWTRKVYQRGPMQLTADEAQEEYVATSTRFAFVLGSRWDGKYWVPVLGARPPAQNWAA